MYSHSLIEWLREESFFTLHHLCLCFSAEKVGSKNGETPPIWSPIHLSAFFGEEFFEKRAEAPSEAQDDVR